MALDPTNFLDASQQQRLGELKILKQEILDKIAKSIGGTKGELVGGAIDIGSSAYAFGARGAGGAIPRRAGVAALRCRQDPGFSNGRKSGPIVHRLLSIANPLPFFPVSTASKALPLRPPRSPGRPAPDDVH